MTEENKGSIIPWILGGIIGAAIVYYWLKNRPVTLQSMGNSQSHPVLNINLSGMEERFQQLEYRMETLQHTQKYSPNTYLTMSQIPKPLVEATIDTVEVKKEVQEMELNMEQFNSGRGREAMSRGDLTKEAFGDYYDVNTTTAQAVATDPNDYNSNFYDFHQIYVTLGRKAKILYVANDNANTQEKVSMFVCLSHAGGASGSKEEIIYSGEVKEYHNVYELKVRSTVKGHNYRVSEYNVRKI